MPRANTQLRSLYVKDIPLFKTRMYLRQTAQHEELERQRITYHRLLHKERLERIMDERHRELGYNVADLQKQMEEKKARDAEERAQEMDYQRRFLEEQRLLGRLARQEQKIRRQVARDDDEFRRNFQQPEQSREYDIWRPGYKKVQPPVRATDNDPWLSVSGCQKMEGEDLTSEDRHKRQREQRIRWFQQQSQENENRRAQELADQREWERRYLENDRLMQEIEERQQLARKEVKQRQDEENLRTASEKRRQRAEERADEDALNKWEQMETLNGPFMSESRDQAIGWQGKRVVQNWKGFSEQETKQVFEERNTQISDNARRRAEEAARERREEAIRQREAREAMRRERADQRARRQREIELAEEYKRQMDDEKEKERYRNKELYGENQPQEDFWKHFSCSHR